jgi:hypothetical protein
MPTLQVGTYRLVSERVRLPVISGSLGSTAIRMTAPGGVSVAEPLVVIIYDGSLFIANISTDGTQLTAHYPVSSCLGHLEILQTEAPVFFTWAVDPAGEVTGINLWTGAEFVGEGPVDI